MKEYFKHAKGFLNINDEYIFLTISGNWSETHKLKEKSTVKLITNKIFLNYLFISVLLGIGAYDVLKDFRNKSFPFGIVLIALGILAFLKRDKGNSFKVPLVKIIKITIAENSATIVFYNKNDVEDLVEITTIESKGLGVLERITQQLNI